MQGAIERNVMVVFSCICVVTCAINPPPPRHSCRAGRSTSRAPDLSHATATEEEEEEGGGAECIDNLQVTEGR